MALRAGDGGVLARQREARELMIKEDLVFPAVDIVAAAAIRPEPRFMRVIIGMAADAGGWRQFDVRWLFVTRLAQHWFMRAS